MIMKVRSVKTKTKLRLGIYLFLFAAICVVIGLSWQRESQRKHLPEAMRQTIEENHRIGKMKQKIKVSGHQAIAIYYPHLGSAEVDANIESAIAEAIEKFEQENQGVEGLCTLYADYESYELNERYGSVQISFERTGAVNMKEVRAWTFDLQQDRLIRFSDLFSAEGMKHLAFLTRSFLTTLAPGQENQDYEMDENVLINNKAELYLGEDELRVVLPPQTLKAQKEELIAVIPLNKVIGYVAEDTRNLLGLQTHGRIIDPTRPMVAMTYDDGPNRQVTPVILDALKEHNGAATFFVLGSRVANHQDIVKRMLDEGSEVGNHTFGHVDLTKQSSQGILDQLAATWEAIQEAGSLDHQELLVRPTYGAYNDTLKKTSPYPLILWSIDTRDWAHQNADKSVDEVMRDVQDGDIILMHDMYEPTAQASVRVIEWLSEQGYQLVTVSELFEARGIQLEPGKTYNCAYPTKAH